MGETFTCEKAGKIGDDRFRRLIAHDRTVRMEMGRAEPIGTTSADINHRNPVVKREKGCNTRTSQEVTHPSTTLAQARLTAEFRWDPVH
ncbi:hypothetical protein VitviT2T_026713 [Vitis vinifera]|uniref:Uncharacterized protein n=1 Tax=Vitis vinifera TaxID=29760 RepID=A0ABY9DNA2_VITVI|nr:hypothetical protein VitviT2T_026713 [Vitis vinifera]